LKRNAFDSLIERLDREFKANPKYYLIRLFLFAALGYLYLFAVLTLAAALLALLVWLLIQPKGSKTAVGQGIFWIGGLAFIILRSLWVSLPPPVGYRLCREEAEQLFDTINELKRALKGPKIHHIIIDHQINASVYQRPRLGVFGWYENYLVIGFPLMLMLTPNQLKAVLAHEMGHLSKAHGLFSVWMYRVTTTWHQLNQNIASQEKAFTFLFRRFFEWYVPRFEAYSFVLVRDHEKIADAYSARYAQEKEAAGAFINMQAIAPFVMDVFYENIYNLDKKMPEPPADFYDRMMEAIKSEITPEQAKTALEKAKARKPSTDDPHPSFSERIAALKQQVSYEGVPQETSAAYYFGNNFGTIKESMSGDWKRAMAREWAARRSAVEKAGKTLKELEVKAATSPLISSEMRELGYATELAKSVDAAIPIYYEALRMDPGNLWINYTLGRILIMRDKEDGLVFLKKAAEKDINVPIQGHQAVYRYLVDCGRDEEAKAWQDRSAELLKEAELGMQERYLFKASDEYESHSLPAAEIECLRKQVALFPEVKEAYYARKKVKYFPDSPYFVFGIITTRKWFVPESKKRVDSLRERLDADMKFPYNTMVAFFDARERTLFPIKKIKKLENSRIYQR